MDFLPSGSPGDDGERENFFRMGMILVSILFLGWMICFFTNYEYLFSVAVLITVFVIAIVYTNTDLALFLMLFGIYFQDSPVEFISVAVPVATLATLIVFPLIWAFRRHSEPIVRIRLKSFGFSGKFLYLFVAFFFLSALAAEYPGKTLVKGIAFPIFSFFLVVLNDYLRTRRRVHIFVRNLCLVVTILAFYGILQWIVVRKQIFLFLNEYIVPISWRYITVKIGWATGELGQFKSRAVFYHQNIYGAVLASIAPILIGLFYFHRKRSYRAFFGVSFLAVSLALILASSRGGLLNYMVGCGVALLYIRPKHFWKMVFAGAAGMAGFIIVYIDKIIYYLRLSTGLSGRSQIWEYSLQMIQDSPWLGVGFLNMGEEFYSRFGPAYIVDMMLFFDRIHYETQKISFESFHAHNLYLNLAVEMGVFIALAALVFYLLVITRLFLFLKREKLKKWERMIAIGIMGVVCGSFVHSFFDTNTLHYIFLHIVVLMGIERAYIVRLVERDYIQRVEP
ncbi:MAG: O-antigen ligase family protein [Candidatus Aureabacteria bacterium]|nr:O-antigen ligase family protein [Candidatus Auribacterota bacterium]